MAKKLVFDRPLSIMAQSNTYVTVPGGEVWKVCVNKGGSGEAYVSDDDFNLFDRIFGAGTGFKSTEITLIIGIAFKVVER